MDSKQNKLLFPIIIVLLFVLAGYQLFSGAIKKNKLYTDALTQAREYADKGLVDKSLEQYKLALSYKTTYEILKEEGTVIRQYKGDNSYIEFLNADMTDFNEKDPFIYEQIGDIYADQESWDQFFTNYYNAVYLKEVSTKLQDLYNKNQWQYNENNISGQVTDLYSTYNAAGKALFWSKGGVVNINGKKDENGKSLCFADLKGVFSTQCFKEGDIWPVVDGFTTARLFDESTSTIKPQLVNGGLSAVSQNLKTYTAFGGANKTLFLAQDPDKDNRWVYLDDEFAQQVGGKDFFEARMFGGGIANVRENEDSKWTFINQNGNSVGDKSFEEIKYDANGVAASDGVFFAKEENNSDWCLYTSKLDKVTGGVAGKCFEDVEAFIPGQGSYAAVEQDGKWGFIDATGNLKIPFDYAGAHSCANDACGVGKNSTSWGFVNTDNEMIIDYDFPETYQMQPNGIALVQSSDSTPTLKSFALIQVIRYTIKQPGKKK
ncbi:MAG: WG repeat-containing protein [Bifidobacteriaceae bacterium]|jgi:hypothetical protein|nr:WG repeat-containing protein [Bifidobacteriaceae bacterium]